MKRPQYVFRPNLNEPQHRRAWALLQQVPSAKRKEFLVQAMTKNKFWEVIDNARAIAPALEGEPLRESLYKQLLKLSPDELVGFDCAWQEYRRIANSPQLIAAACIINGGTSDDRFDYFKNWLILQGQYVFRQALKDPDALAEFKIPFDDTEWEDCGYLVYPRGTPCGGFQV